jgi:catechol 2,3-dioxygenase-like lactoylglutathione lyase family enzyme
MTTPLTDLPRLQHVTITFPRGAEHRLREFYTGVLGFREKPVPRVAKPLGWIWFQTAEAGTELHFVPDERPVPPDSAHHLCIQVEDLENYRASLAKAGFLVQEARPLPFRPRFFTRDPFNNLIEVVRVEGDYIEAGEAAP